jgi:threonine aldolase
VTTPTLDLRSDTVTRPTAGMRQAMAEAVVGDDVFGDDPTVQALEARVAELAGKEAAVFVPSGTMGNQLAVKAQTEPGDEVLLERYSHLFINEQGGIASNSGCLAHPVRGPRGVLPIDDVRGAFRAEDEHIAHLTLVCLENTHNAHGGAIVPLETVRAIARLAHERGARVHLDGARLWHAQSVTGIPIREWARDVDTLMMCFSKALGAPVGSILVGPRDTIQRARRIRKRWGGSMRQVGVLAAACLYALDHHLERLAEDHTRARRLAAGLRAPGVSVLEPETNIVMIDLEHPALERDAVRQAMADRGVLLWMAGPRRLRAIPHLDVDDAGIERAIATFHDVVRDLAPAAV